MKHQMIQRKVQVQEMQLQETQIAIIYNLVDTLIHPFVVPPEYKEEFFRLRQQGEAGFREYDAKSVELLIRGDIGIKPIDGAVELLHRINKCEYANAIYSHSSEERLRLIFQTLGWDRLIDANYGTLDRPEIYDKEASSSYRNLVKIMQGYWNPEIYVTHKDREAIAASRILTVFLISGGKPARRINHFGSIADIADMYFPRS